MQALIAEVSLTQIKRNAERIVRFAKRPLIAVVKDEAYGHGGIEVALALQGTASMFAVASVREGAALRTAGVQEDILVLTPPLGAEEAERLLSYGLTACLCSYPVLRLLAEAGDRTGETPRAHLCVNTGMNRYGFPAVEASRAAKRAKSRGISVEGLFSHLYLPADERAREEQNARFRIAAEGVKRIFPEALLHLSATGGIPFDEWDAVRSGLALYGYLPEHCALPAVKPAAKLYATVAQAGRQSGGGAGYAAAERDYGRLYTLRLGYGDGFFREGAPFAIGKLCMDACVCEGKARFGQRMLVTDDFAAYAAAHNTSVYEALVRLLSKAEKRYVREGRSTVAGHVAPYGGKAKRGSGRGEEDRP